MTIAPIVRAVEVTAPPAKAFEVFAARMADWWPRGKTIGPGEHQDVVMEPRVGGRWFERNREGVETNWGRVLEWDPPRRLALAWQITSNWTFDEALLTTVEVTFNPLPGGGTRVTLEHRDLERFGQDAAAHRALLDGGWPTMLGMYAAVANRA